jgi:hypothetical protein
MLGRKPRATTSACLEEGLSYSHQSSFGRARAGGYSVTGQEFPLQRQSLLDTVFPVDLGADAPVKDLDAWLEELRTADDQVDPPPRRVPLWWPGLDRGPPDGDRNEDRTTGTAEGRPR